MLVKLSLIVALCSGVSFHDVQKKMQDLQTANPGVQIILRLDKKAACVGGQVLTGKDAKLLEALGK